MNKYALAKLVESVDSVDARKRLQKCVFLLQTAGCKLDAKFRLHYYGPYSRDVAQATDLLAHSGVFDEESHRHDWGERYSYKITDHGRELVSNHEATQEGAQDKEAVAPYLELFGKLNSLALWPLELAATIAFFYRQKGLSWEEAKKNTAQFKNVGLGEQVLVEAEELAREHVLPGS